MEPPELEDGGASAPCSVETERSDPPEPSHVSIKRRRSIDVPIFFKNEDSSKYLHAEVHNILKENLREKFQCLYEGIAKQGNPTLLNEIYTDLYITESGSGEISNEHESRWIEKAFRRAETEDTPIKCNNIFTPLVGQDKHIQKVLTKGVAGIGKTVCVQKFIMDWAEGKANQDIYFIFPLPFRELNLIRNQKVNITSLLQMFFTEAKEIDMSRTEHKMLFIFDGLDECRLSLDFQNNVSLVDVNASASVDVLLTNLIKGNLLPSALIWITSRPAAAELIPSECVDRVTEVRGFNDPQKEEYFRKRISDQIFSNKIITHLKSSRSLYIMCHIPVFCWISATVLESMLRAESGDIPKNLTQMYTHFLIIQINIKNEKDYEMKEKDEDIILKLGKLAFQQLMKGNLIFYEDDLRECGIDEKDASVYSGLCTQIFKQELGVHQRKMYCFVHLSIQEHIAALYVLYSFSLKNVDILSEYQTSQNTPCFTVSKIFERAVEESLQSKNGHLDLFIRFLLGLSLESNQSLFQCLLTQTGGKSYNKEEIIQHIKRRIRENLSPEKSINLFHCLNELGDHTLETEIQDYLKAGTIKDANLSPSQWSALVFVLLTSEHLDDFELKKFIRDELNQTHITQDQVLLNLLPVVKASRSAQLGCCGLTVKSCAYLASALSSEYSCLKELNLNRNHLLNSGVMLLSAGLGNPHCKLKTLCLWYCGVTDEGCAALASALKSNPSHLTELDLSENDLGDSGVKMLSAELENPLCKLESLKLRLCNFRDEACAALASALRSNASHLRELNLSENEIEDSGVKMLSYGLENPNCKLETLWLRHCAITDKGSAALASALRSNPSHLTELDMIGNELDDSGVNQLSTLKMDPHYKLEKLHYD
ncbi:NACHT, LRR and PYD domains-containing protein 3-like [Xyrauchen texanus]|uniref:NACHT, LRR and PYD domains-containing protein 3-like n=1 Tax=Xyrauchen texanus TaxID=154827 RepID=UPI0022423AA2|nr:NACHT, LRR and PYD domains-containing protein 3-like [Xyrauchen texanus]